MMKTEHIPCRRRGLARAGAFSILEILIAVVIIGILAVLMVPTLQNRVEQARIRAAQRDLTELREAETRAAIDTGYYFPQHVLDNVVVVGTDPGFPAWDNVADSFLHEAANPAVEPTKTRTLFINPRTGLFLPDAEAQGLYDRIILSGLPTPDARVASVRDRFGFKGPYVSWNSDRDYDDMQDDPWGNPYMFFTPAGLIWEYNSRDRYNFSNLAASGPGRIQHQVVDTWDHNTWMGNAGGADCKVFDRPAVLSLGANGVPGDDVGKPDYNKFGAGDDIVIWFN